MDEIEQKKENLYQKYLKEKLDLIFSEETGIPINSYIFKNHYNRVDIFQNEYTRVEKNDEYNIINTEGKLVSKEWFDYAWSFHGGYAAVEKNGKYNFINTEGKLLSNEWFEGGGYFHEGYAKVKKNNKWNFINTEGKLLLKEWFDDADDFSKGYALVKKNDKYNFINTEGKLLSEEWFDNAWYFHGDYALVEKNDKYNFINTEGKLLSNEWLVYADSFHGDYALVKKNDKYNFINTEGKFLSEEWFDGAGPFEEGYAEVKKNGKCKYINIQGIIENTYQKIIDNYKVTNTTFGYKCTKMDDTDSFKIKHTPIKFYGLRYTLCIGYDYVLYLYNREENNYIRLGKENNFCYEDNFIFDKTNKKVYFIYDDKILDITDYYLHHLSDKDEIKITKGIPEIYSKEEFTRLSMTEIEYILEREHKRNIKVKAELLKQQEDEIKETKRKETEAIQKEKEEKTKQVLNQLKEALEIIQENSVNNIQRININNLFLKVEDHLEISPIYIDILKYIDLHVETFKDVKISGIDFRGCNLSSAFNPQEVYQKDLSGCDFDKIFISPFMNFRGVNIKGCRFSEDDDPLTEDIFNVTFHDAIYDETTTYNGISFTKLFPEDKNHKNRN